MNINILKVIKVILILGVLIINSQALYAGNFGSDLNLTLTPAAGGMGGVGYVRPTDPVASVFGNPATLGQLEGPTDFTFGASYLNVSAHADHDGTVTGIPFEADSDSEHYLIPNIAVRHRLMDQLTVGGGLQVVSGLGADFRNATALAPKVELIVFGANVGASYDITPQTSIGANFTLAFGLLELGLISNTGLSETFGGRGSVGATHDFGFVEVGLTYNTELELEFEEVTEVAPRSFTDFKLQQPREVIFGIASSPDLWENLLLETNVIWKNWSNATAYKDIWEDNFTVIFGGQYKLNKWKFRLGYSYATDFQKENVGSSIGNISTLNVGGATVPVSPPLVQFVQATLTQPYWQQQISGGIGFNLTDKVRFDVQAGYAYDGERTIGATRLDVNEFQAGAGFTWEF